MVDLLGKAVKGGGGKSAQPCRDVEHDDTVGLRLELLQLGLKRIRMDDAGQPRLRVPEKLGALFQRRRWVLHEPTGNGLMRVIQLEDTRSAGCAFYDHFSHTRNHSEVVVEM